MQHQKSQSLLHHKPRQTEQKGHGTPIPLLNKSKDISKQNNSQHPNTKKYKSNVCLTLDIEALKKKQNLINVGDYYMEIDKFKQDFIEICSRSVNAAIARNLWNQWIIIVLGVQEQTLHLIPSFEAVVQAKDYATRHLNKKMQENGQDSEKTYNEIIERTQTLIDKHRNFKSQAMHDAEILREANSCITINLNNESKKWGQSQQNTVCSFMEQANYDTASRAFERFADQNVRYLKNFYMFELAFNYAYIGGLSYQWCVPPPAMELLKEKFSVEMELFASPLNHFNSRFYSLFEMDRQFGGLGNCLQAKELSGAGYEANPPFIENIMELNANQIIASLKKCQTENKSFFCMYVMPWDDCAAYDILVKQNPQFLLGQLFLERKHHFYFEVTQQVYQAAPFNTHLIFVGAGEDTKNNFNQQIIQKIQQLFTHPEQNK